MSNRRSHLILVGLILAALAGVALLAFPSSPAHKKVTLGLDLQGGLEVVLKAVPPPGKTCDSACMDRSVSIMRSRIDKLGVSEPEIRKQGKDQIVIQLAGVHDVNKAAQIIGTTAQLQFYDFEVDTVGPSNDGAHHAIANGSLYDLLSKVKADTKKGASSYYLFNAKKKPVAGPEATRERLLNATLPSGRRLNGEVPEGFTVLAVPPKQIVISCDQATTGCQGVQQVDATAPTVYYLFKYDPNNPTNPIPEATGEDLKLSDIAADISTQGQGNVVRLGFTGKGADKFHDITRKEAQRGAADAAAAGQTGSDAATIQQFAQHFAIVLDGQLQSTPYIDYKQNPDGIDPTGTGAEISNISSIGEAKDLALVLQTGALPVKFEQIERTDVSATLGKDSLKEAKLAALIGLLVVAAFLLVLYRFLGVVAVVGLGIYAAFLYAAILRLQRHADAAGLRRPDPHDRRRGRRERRHLRTDQGRSARRQVRARRDPGRLRQGLPHDHRRERRDRDHGAGAVRRRHRRRQGLRPDADDRHSHLADHRRRGDARDARTARRLPLVREPELHGRER